ncbi:alpha/beta hydrolase [Candidatus Enterococcus willemsii]|nr:alpha/beta hydrolase-fold protein [Enterococcus sp. CU12B]
MMTLIESYIYSETLMRDVSVSVLLPLPSITNAEYGEGVGLPSDDHKYQTLWLVHSATGDHTKFIRGSRIEAFSRANKMAVVMMGVDNSFGCNVPNIGNYFDYITEELPKTLQAIYPLSDRREDNFIGGTSMGGFAAFMASLRKPEKYAAAFSISGALAIEELEKIESVRPWYINVTNALFGENRQYYNPHEHDLQTMAEDLLQSNKEQPALYACCGTEDMYYRAGYDVIQALRAKGLNVTYEEGPGAHDWDYWDPQLGHIMRNWLPKKGDLVHFKK